MNMTQKDYKTFDENKEPRISKIQDKATVAKFNKYLGIISNKLALCYLVNFK